MKSLYNLGFPKVILNGKLFPFVEISGSLPSSKIKERPCSFNIGKIFRSSFNMPSKTTRCCLTGSNFRNSVNNSLCLSRTLNATSSFDARASTSEYRVPTGSPFGGVNQLTKSQYFGLQTYFSPLSQTHGCSDILYRSVSYLQLLRRELVPFPILRDQNRLRRRRVLPRLLRLRLRLVTLPSLVQKPH